MDALHHESSTKNVTKLKLKSKKMIGQKLNPPQRSIYFKLSSSSRCNSLKRKARVKKLKFPLFKISKNE